MEIAGSIAGIYVLGVVIGLLKADAAPVARVGWAVLWPVGPAAFVVTVTVLLAAAVVVIVTIPLARGSASAGSAGS